MTTPPLPRPTTPLPAPTSREHQDPGPALVVRRAGPPDGPVLARLWPLFRHDLAEHRPVLPRPDGTYRDERLRAALTAPGHEAWLLVLGEHPVGFVLVRPGAGGGSVLTSLFVVRGARGRGLGRRAVRAVAAARPGAWEVAHQHENASAAAFWPRIAAELDPEGWAQEDRPVPDRPDLPPDAWVSFRSGAQDVDGRVAGPGATMAAGLRAPSPGAPAGPPHRPHHATTPQHRAGSIAGPSAGSSTAETAPGTRGDDMSLSDDDITTSATAAGAHGDADSGDSDTTQVDPAGTDPSGVDPAGGTGGDADSGDSDSTQVDPAGTDPSGVDPAGGTGGDADSGDSDSTQVDPAGTDPAGVDPVGS